MTQSAANEKIKNEFETKESIEIIFKIIQYSILGFTILFGLVTGGLALFGLQTINDINSMASSAVDRELSKMIDISDESTSSFKLQIEKIGVNLSNLKENIESLSGDLNDVEFLFEIVKEGQTDPVGDYLALNNELSGNKFDQNDPKNRKRVEIVLRRLLDHSNKNFVRSDITYNASATASQFLFSELGAELAEQTYSTKNNDEYRARMLRFQASAGKISSKEAADEIFDLIPGVSRPQIHLVASEAFNIALEGDLLPEFVESIVSARAKMDQEAPSYLWIISAQARLINGAFGDVRIAVDELAEGLRRVQTESPLTPWYAETIRDSGLTLSRMSSMSNFSDELAELSMTLIGLME